MTGDMTADPQSLLTRVSSWLALQFSELDPRWAGVFRILLGFALLADLGRRAQTLTVFFSNEGVLPNHFALFEPIADGTVSVYSSLSRPGEVAVGFVLTALVYLAFTAGFHSRLSHLMALGCVISLDARNLLVEDAGATLLVALVLLSLPLPLGRRLARDARSGVAARGCGARRLLRPRARRRAAPGSGHQDAPAASGPRGGRRELRWTFAVHCPHRPVEASSVQADPHADRRVNAAASPERIKHCGVNAAVCALSQLGSVPQWRLRMPPRPTNFGPA